MNKLSTTSALTIVLFSLLFFSIYFFISNQASSQTKQNRPSLTNVPLTHQDSVLEKRVDEILATKEPHDKFFESLEGMNSAYSQQFDKFLGLFTILGLVFLIFQIQLGSQENKRMNEINEAYKVSIERTTSFIGSYEQLIKLKETAADIEAYQTKERDRLSKLRLEKQTEINAKAIRLVSDVFRANYGSTFLGDDAVRKFRSFFIEASAVISLYESSEEAEATWNGDVYFLMGLDQYLEKQPVDTKKFLDKAIDKVTGFLGNPINAEKLSVLFPATENERYAEIGGIEGWNKKLYSVCLFYQGQNHYRRKEYLEASVSFHDALELFPFDTDSIFFLFQSKFWDKAFDSLKKHVDEMESMVSAALEVHPDLDEYAKKAIRARLYMKLGDFCVNHVGHDIGLKEAIGFYDKSYGLLKELDANLPLAYSHIAPMTYFAFAKALAMPKEIDMGLDLSAEESDDLFQEAKRECVSIIQRIENRETRYILYYILSECQRILDADSNEASYNNNKALESFKDYCSHPSFYGYSPLSNSMMPKAQVENEIIEHGKIILRPNSA